MERIYQYRVLYSNQTPSPLGWVTDLDKALAGLHMYGSYIELSRWWSENGGKTWTCNGCEYSDCPTTEWANYESARKKTERLWEEYTAAYKEQTAAFEMYRNNFTPLIKKEGQK